MSPSGCFLGRALAVVSPLRPGACVQGGVAGAAAFSREVVPAVPLQGSLAHRQPAFPSLPVATWQDSDQLVPAAAWPLGSVPVSLVRKCRKTVPTLAGTLWY